MGLIWNLRIWHEQLVYDAISMIKNKIVIVIEIEIEIKS